MSRKQIVVIGAVVALIAICFGVQRYASSIAKKKVDASLANIANFVDVEYQKVDVDLLGMNLRVSGITFSAAGSKAKTRIDQIVVRDFDDKSDMPSFLSVAVKGVEIDPGSLGKDAKLLRELGYEHRLLFNSDIEYRYDKEKQDLSLRKLTLGADGVGEITVTLRLHNINLAPEQILGLLFTYPQILFYEAKIDYKDASLAERLLEHGARQKNMESKQFKKAMIEELEEEIKREKDDFIKSALSAIQNFIDKPKGFSISATPSKPQPFERILRTDDPKDFIKLLNIQIKS